MDDLPPAGLDLTGIAPYGSGVTTRRLFDWRGREVRLDREGFLLVGADRLDPGGPVESALLLDADRVLVVASGGVFVLTEDADGRPRLTARTPGDAA